MNKICNQPFKLCQTNLEFQFRWGKSIWRKWELNIFLQGILSISEEIWSGPHSESSNGRMFNKFFIPLDQQRNRHWYWIYIEAMSATPPHIEMVFQLKETSTWDWKMDQVDTVLCKSWRHSLELQASWVTNSLHSLMVLLATRGRRAPRRGDSRVQMWLQDLCPAQVVNMNPKSKARPPRTFQQTRSDAGQPESTWSILSQGGLSTPPRCTVGQQASRPAPFPGRNIAIHFINVHHSVTAVLLCPLLAAHLLTPLTTATAHIPRDTCPLVSHLYKCSWPGRPPAMF